jgi:hypothetical protein
LWRRITYLCTYSCLFIDRSSSRESVPRRMRWWRRIHPAKKGPKQTRTGTLAKRRTKKFSKVLCSVALCSKCTGPLTFDNVQKGAQGKKERGESCQKSPEEGSGGAAASVFSHTRAFQQICPPPLPRPLPPPNRGLLEEQGVGEMGIAHLPRRCVCVANVLLMCC